MSDSLCPTEKPALEEECPEGSVSCVPVWTTGPWSNCTDLSQSLQEGSGGEDYDGLAGRTLTIDNLNSITKTILIPKISE